MVRALTDDNGLVLRSCDELEFILKEYARYALFTKLHLNLKKSYVVPLFHPGDIAMARDVIVGRAPGAASMCFAFYAMYLGVYLGPGAMRLGGKLPY